MRAHRRNRRRIDRHAKANQIPFRLRCTDAAVFSAALPETKAPWEARAGGQYSAVPLSFRFPACDALPVIPSLPFCFSHPYASMRMEPFEDDINGRGDFVRQIVMNVIMTVLFEFLYPMRRRAAFC